jgi:guanine deaminase
MAPHQDLAMAVVATVMQTPTSDGLQVLADVVVGVDGEGTITAVEPASSSAGAQVVSAAAEVVRTSAGTVLLPGLVDLHVHAPQWPQLGTGLDLPLETWLFEHTFPLEARYRDLAFARTVWADLVGTLLRHGTTTAVYFATNDLDATTELARAVRSAGQRAFVGRVAMDHPEGTPEWYRDASAGEGIEASATSITAIRKIDDGRGLVEPIITPRFTPACTDELLAGLGALAASTGVRVQTHCAESDWARDHPIARFGTTDAVALDRFGLIRPATVLAHSNHITDADADLIVAARAGIAHCPLSNAYFANGVLPVRHLLGRGVRIGLGTDIAGGASPSLLGQCHDAVTMSRVLDDGSERGAPGASGSAIDVVTAFWLGTMGGAAVLDIPVGLIEVGRRFDAVLVDTSSRSGALRVWDGLDDAARTFEKIVRLAGPGDISAMWVDGRRVIG